MTTVVILSVAKHLPAECGAGRKKILRCAQDDGIAIDG